MLKVVGHLNDIIHHLEKKNPFRDGFHLFAFKILTALIERVLHFGIYFLQEGAKCFNEIMDNILGIILIKL